MGNCMKTRVKKIDQMSTSLIKGDPSLFIRTNSVPKVAERPAVNRRNIGKQKAPVADNRLQHQETAEAASAVVAQRQKSSKERQEIIRALKNHFLFASLPVQYLELVIEDTLFYSIGQREIVCAQGQPGHNFYIVDGGKLEIIINGKTRGYLSKGDSFGELALMHDSNRTATIRTVEPSTLWAIDRQRIRRLLQTINEDKLLENKTFIQSVPLFQMLTEEQKEQLLAVSVSQEFSHGQQIVVEGDPGDAFYMIKSGEVSCFQKGTEFRRMGKGECFGEQALLYNSERTATVISVGISSFLSIGREQLISVLGANLQHIIYKNSQRIALEQNSAFQGLTKKQVEAVVNQMKVVAYRSGEKVIRANTHCGDKMWIVLQGSLTTSNTHREVSVLQCIGDSYLVSSSSTDTFKEDYIASTDSNVAEITKDELERSIGASLQQIFRKNEQVAVLKTVNILRNLPNSTLDRLASTFRLKEYPAQAVIFSEGEPGSEFFIVKEGHVEVIKNQTVIRTIGQHDYFGERAILLNELRTATVVSKGSSLWVINQHEFLNLVDQGLQAQLLKRMELQDDTVTLNELKHVKTLGQGMFGHVVLTVHAQKNILYALKTVPRNKIGAYDIYENILLERQILLKMDHPFVVKLVKTFKDDRRLYFLMEFVQGMDLFDVLRVLNLLNNDSAKFYAACLVLIMEHLHEQQTIYRDLKPENIIVDESGYLKLIDFGTAKQIQGRTFTVVGTPHYMAPEVIMGKGYTFSADLWTVGVMLFEFICGYVPFGEEEDDPARIYEKVVQHRLLYPSYATKNLQCRPLIEQLLSSNPALRGTAKGLKQHAWLDNFDWDNLIAKHLKAPYVPPKGNLKAEVANSIKKKGTVSEAIEREEAKEQPIQRKIRPGPRGWDDEF